MTAKHPASYFAEAHRLYQTGMSCGKVSEQTGIDAEVLREGFHRYGYPVRSRAEGVRANVRLLVAADKEWAIAAYARYISGEDPFALATELNTTRTILYHRFNALSLKLLSPSKAKRFYAQRIGLEGRQRITAAAHEAVRGMKRTPEDLGKRALGVERIGKFSSLSEVALYEALTSRGIAITQQKACGPYNIDLAAPPSVAVEIYGCYWHTTQRQVARHARRTRHLIDAGWHVLVVWVEGLGDFDSPTAANYIISFLKKTSRYPSMRRQYRMIWGTGEEIARGCSKDNNFPLEPAGGKGDKVRCQHQ